MREVGRKMDVGLSVPDSSFVTTVLAASVLKYACEYRCIPLTDKLLDWEWAKTIDWQCHSSSPSLSVAVLTGNHGELREDNASVDRLHHILELNDEIGVGTD